MAIEDSLTPAALIEALYPKGESLDKVEVSSIVNRIEEYFDTIPSLSYGLSGLLVWLNARFLVVHGKTFASAPLVQGQQFLSKNSNSFLSVKLLRALETPFRMAYLLVSNNLKRVGRIMDCLLR